MKNAISSMLGMAVMAASAISALANPLLLWDMEAISGLGGGAALTLHHPEFHEVAIVHDAPWEGNVSTYHTVFQDGDKYRMYYRGMAWDMPGVENHEVYCYAESKDGIHWVKPSLGICEFNGSTDNNIILLQDPNHNSFAPCIDANPACPPEQRYKALGGEEVHGLYLYVSPDGIHWKKAQEEPIFIKKEGDRGVFDSLNTMFYDTVQGCYVANLRYYKYVEENGTWDLRQIRRCTSPDAIHWSEPQWLDTGPNFPSPDSPPIELYTNAIVPYVNNPAVYIGLPKRYVFFRGSVYDHSGENSNHACGLSDAAFMSSRDGLRYHLWSEAFIRPGLQHDRWVNRNTMCARGVVLTPSDLQGTPPVLSLYSTEGYYSDGPCRLRRHVIRQDGFVSVQAPYSGGTVTLKPLAVTVTETSQLPGRKGVTVQEEPGWSNVMLLLNASTSALGEIRCEIRDSQNRPIPGYTMAEAVPVFGDELDLPMVWKNGPDLTPLLGQTVILHFAMKDADIYSLRFGHP